MLPILLDKPHASLNEIGLSDCDTLFLVWGCKLKWKSETENQCMICWSTINLFHLLPCFHKSVCHSCFENRTSLGKCLRCQKRTTMAVFLKTREIEQIVWKPSRIKKTCLENRTSKLEETNQIRCHSGTRPCSRPSRFDFNVNQ